MKRKDLKAIATQIAKAEKTIQISKDKLMVEKAKQEILELSSKIDSMNDFFVLDELVQEILS